MASRHVDILLIGGGLASANCARWLREEGFDGTVTLAGMVGARRPSVTTALGQLSARGAIERRPDGGWILRGDPPERRPGNDTGAGEPIPFQRSIGV